MWHHQSMLLRPRLGLSSRRHLCRETWRGQFTGETSWQPLQMFWSQLLGRNPANPGLGSHCSQSEVAERGQGSPQFRVPISISLTSFHMESSPSAVPIAPAPTAYRFNLFCLPWGWGRHGCLHEGVRHGIWGLPISYTTNPVSCITCTPTLGDTWYPQLLSLSGGSEVEISLLWGFAHYWLRIQLWSRMLF